MAGRLCRCVGAWCVLTLLWAGGVLTVLALRLEDQVAASEDLARDIAALDGGGGALVTQWYDLVSLVLEYRASMLLELLLLPPLAVLVVGLAVVAWRRWTKAPSARPAYSAAARRAAPSRLM
jgi:hypothetical protein